MRGLGTRPPVTVPARAALSPCRAPRRRAAARPPTPPTRFRAAAAAVSVSGVGALPEALPPLDASYASAVAFSDYAHWLIPGHLMAGRYPFVEPGRCKSRDAGEAQLEAILGVGITRFVCLQAELPPQEALPVGGKAGFLPYRPTATLIAASLSGPPSLEVMDGLRNPHLDAFLPPRRKADRHANDAVHVAAAAERNRVEVTFGHCPIPDLGIPTVDAAEAVVADVCARLLAGDRLYIHCWGGRGRAGTVGACALARLYGLTADDALARVDAALQTREPGGRSPEKDEQRAFVRAFVARGA